MSPFLHITRRSAPTTSLTQQATKLCVAKVQAQQDTNDLEMNKYVFHTGYFPEAVPYLHRSLTR